MSRIERTAQIASRLKLTSLVERVRGRPVLLVLVYHRIMRLEDSRYDPNVIEATPEQFDDQMAALRKSHVVIDPEEICDLVANPSKLRAPRVGITFDDGYRDNYSIAFPILKSHGFKAMFFLPTHYVGEKHLTWWDQIGWVIRNTKRAAITLAYPRPVTIMIDRDAPTMTIRKVLHLMTKDSRVDRKRFMAEIARAADLAMPEQAEERQFLSWDEAREMERAGMMIGSHTHSHEILASIPEAEQKEQCRRSRELLVEHGIKADCLAYPVGHRDSYSDATIRAAKEAGYRFAFTNHGGLNTRKNMDRFSVQRLGMDSSNSLSEFRLRLALTNVSGRALW